MTGAESRQHTFPARIEFLHPCCEFVRAGAKDAGLTPADIDKLDLIVEELFTNVVRYAYTDHPTGGVDVSYIVEKPGRLLIRISDYGRDFNPLASDPPDFSRGLADRPVGGLGIFLVKSIAESITYTRDGDRNTVAFTFCGSPDNTAE